MTEEASMWNSPPLNCIGSGLWNILQVLTSEPIAMQEVIAAWLEALALAIA